jgi:gas vesicle protein
MQETNGVSQNFTKFNWTDERRLAAQLLAMNEKTDEQIAAECGVTRRMLAYWKKHPEFTARVNEIVQQTADKLLKQGVRLKENRLAKLQGMLDRMAALVEARAKDLGKPRTDDDGEETEEIAGGGTGLLVRDNKGKDWRPVYKFDAALLREFREYLKQAAIELGEWTEKRDLTSDGKSLGVVFLPQAPKTMEEWQELCQREITQSNQDRKDS